MQLSVPAAVHTVHIVNTVLDELECSENTVHIIVSRGGSCKFRKPAWIGWLDAGRVGLVTPKMNRLAGLFVSWSVSSTEIIRVH
jgi:hypothetical protein